MSKLSEAKVRILNEIKAKEYVIDAEFDESVADDKPLGWRFFRLNIFHKNEDGEATFSGKGVYIKVATGESFVHSGGVQTKALKPREIPVVEPTPDAPSE